MKKLNDHLSIRGREINNRLCVPPMYIGPFSGENQSVTEKNVEQYVGALLSDRNMILASDIPIETKRDLIRVVFISLYGHSTKSEYSVKQKEEIISSQGFRFRDFEIRRRYK